MINRTKRIKYVLYSILAYLIPMGVLIGIKYNTYFKTTASSFTIIGLIITVIILFVLKSKLAKFNLLPLLIGHIAILVLMELPSVIAEEVQLAVCVSLVGLSLSAIFDNVANYYKRTSYNADGTLNRTIIPDSQAWKEAYDLGISISKE